MQCGDDLSLPRLVAVLDRVRHRPDLELDAQFGDVAEVGDRDRRDRKAAIHLGPHQALRQKMEQGFAQRPDAGVVARAQFVDLEPLPGLELAGEDVLAHMAQHVEGGRLPLGRSLWRAGDEDRPFSAMPCWRSGVLRCTGLFKAMAVS